MSTRGAIAIARGDGWVGVYNHSDSYPTWLGPRIWRYLQEDGYVAFEEAVIRGMNIHTGKLEELQTSEDYNGDLEWVWIASRAVLTIMRMEWRQAPNLNGGNPPVGVSSFPLDGPKPDWVEVECGPNLEHCSHYAWIHDAHAPITPGYSAEDCRRLREDFGREAAS